MRRSPSSLPLLALVALATACPGDDAPADGSGSSTGEDTGSTGTTPPPTTMTMGNTNTSTADSTDSGTTAEPPDTTATEGGSSSSGEPGEPEIEVTVDVQPVASGDRYDLPETVDVGAMGSTVMMNIENTGTGLLELNSVGVVAGDDAEILFDAAGIPMMINPGGFAEVPITFAPTNGGMKEIVVNIDNNDADESLYEVTVGAHTTPNTYRPLGLLAPGVGPGARYNSAMVELGDGRLLLFGGRNAMGTRLNDTWTFDLETEAWTQLTPAMSPSPREAHAMARAGGDTVILFGGNNPGAGGPSNETWSFDAVTDEWTLMAPAVDPPARFQHPMVMVGPDQIMLFGGMNGFGSYLPAETWIYDVVTDAWSNAAPASAPTPRMGHTMAFDGQGMVTLFGGYDDDNIDPGIPIDQTWRYDVVANDWTQATPTTTPGPWFVQASAHYADGSFILHSGKQGTCCNDPDAGTWAYDPMADDWADITPASEPTPRFNHALAAIEGRNKSIIYGGNLVNIGSGGATGEIWEYVGPRP